MENEYEQGKMNYREFCYKSAIKTPNIEEVNFLMKDIIADIEWMLELVDARINELDHEQGNTSFMFSEHAAPSLKESTSAYAQLVNDLELTASERLLLICSIIPHIAPNELTKRLRDDNNHLKLKYREFGGFIDTNFNHFVITQQTLLYLMAGSDKVNMVYYQLAITDQSNLVKEGIVLFEASHVDSGLENELNKVPVLSKEHLLFFRSGQEPRPDYGSAFPARLVTTGMEWEQLILGDNTKNNIQDIMLWVEHGNSLISENNMFNVSFPCLFYGPSGTGKSLTAKLIGKKYNKHVFRIDLSMIVSKYIGETEKNLAHLFDRAQGKDWILFFDEADALFSKRTNINSAQDKWANLEVNYLLQRMEEHRGLTILATNLKGNIDDAMTRRFQSIIYFPYPKKSERIKLWQSLLPKPFSYNKEISFEKLGELKLTGANVSNILKHACLKALDNNAHELKTEWVQEGIRKEFIKENRTP